MMRKKTCNLAFCDSYGYPAVIKEHLSESVSQIMCFLGEDAVRSVIIFGSTSRGELSYIVRDDGRVDLFSDYEFLIITRGKVSKEQARALKQAFHENRVRWQVSVPLFHIEFMLNSLPKFILKTPFLRRIGTYELLEKGITLIGDDLLGWKLGDITAKNLDYGNTNGLILERLWWLLFYMPLSIISGQMTGREEETINYLAARGALEILTVFLPNEGILLPGYRKRVDYFVSHYPEGSYFLPSFHDFVWKCLDHKLNLRAHDSFVNNQRNLLAGYLSLISYLLAGKRPCATSTKALPLVCEELLRTKRNLFPDPIYPALRRLIKDYRVAHELNVPSPVSWMLTEKRRHAIAFLLYAHGALLEYLEEGTMPQQYLRRCADILERLTGRPHRTLRHDPAMAGLDSRTTWMELCREFVHFVVAWRVAPRPQEGDMQEILSRGGW